MDGLLSVAPNCAQSRCYLTFFHIPERSIALVKRLAGSKGWNWSNLPANKVLLKVARILIYMDGLLSVAPNCAQAVAILPLPYSPFTGKTLAGSPKGWNWSQPAYANKVLLHSHIHWWTSFIASNCLNPLLSYLLPIPNVQLLVKRLAGSPRDGLPANKVLLQGARILIYIDGLLVAFPLCKAVYLASLPYSQFQLHWVKRLAGSKELGSNLPFITKCYSRYTIIYIDGPSQSHQAGLGSCYLALFPRSIAHWK
jgi:hypothetical protein